MNPAKWPASLLAVVIVLVIVACLAVRYLDDPQAAGVLGQVVTSAAGLAP